MDTDAADPDRGPAAPHVPRRRAQILPDQPGSRPRLTDVQVEVLRCYGTERRVAAGEVLFSDGDATYDLIVLLDAEAEIVERYGRPDEVVLAVYGSCEFLGEMGLLTGQRPYLAAVVNRAGRILQVPVDQVRVIMAQELDLSELILRAFLVRHARLTYRGSGLTLIGSRFDVDTRRLLEVMARNRLSSRWLDPEESPEADALLDDLEVPPDGLPVVVVPGGAVLRNPSSRALLDALGLVAPPGVDGWSQSCDLLVVGGGPAGLAAAVYGASEGLRTVLAEDTAPGGQAGTSSRIENYLGFPAGLSGEELAARATLQAQKFGVRFMVATRATGLSSDGGRHLVRMEDGQVVEAKAVIIATGARYNRLPLDRLSMFEGVGVYYAATQMEAQACTGGPVVVVGGGNSAGQAALFLARTCTRVHIVIRGPALATSMSHYLIDQIEREPRITVSVRSEVIGLVGTERLEGIELRDNQSHQVSELPVHGLFVFIGAKPSTGWLDGQLAQDEHGFLLTGNDLADGRPVGGVPTPLFLETSRPGVFCVGDVRSRSVKRVATAIGEGSMAVRLVFDRLASMGLTVANQPPSAP